MCSNGLYCSKVAELFKDNNISLNKFNKNLPLRRSQRLSLKLNNNVKVCPRSFFTELKSTPILNDVPLDLTPKSKALTVETSQLKINRAVIISASATSSNIKNIEDSQNNYKGHQNKLFSTTDVTSTSLISKIKNNKKECIHTYDHIENNINLKNDIPENNVRSLPKAKKYERYSTKEDGNLKTTLPKILKNAACAKSTPDSPSNTIFKKMFKVAKTKSLSDIKLSGCSKPKFEMNLLDVTSRDMQRVKRGRKNSRKFSQIVTKAGNQSNGKQHIHQSDVTTAGAINGFSTIASTGAKLNVQNILQTKNEKINSNSELNFLNLNEIKDSRVLSSQIAIVNKKQSSKVNTEDTKYKGAKFKNYHKQIKKEKFSQKSFDERVQTNLSIKKVSSVKNYNTRHYNTQKLSTNEFINQNQDIYYHTEFLKETTSAQKPLQTLQNTESIKENYEIKVEFQDNSSIGNKNYIKSFDKNKVLDKIQNVQNCADYLSVENSNKKKIKAFEIPPSPAESSEEFLKRSILFNRYPPHFKYQLPPEAILTCSLDPQPLPTPEDTISSDLLDSSSSSPSLPESLCEIFKTKDIKDILNLKGTSYHLNSYHIQALALVLNLRIAYLHKMLDKIINTCPNVLKNIDTAVKSPFVPDNDLFSTSPDELWASTNIVQNSQSPKQRKITKIAN